MTYPPFMIVSEQSRDRSRRVRMPLPTGHFALDHCQVQTLPTRQSTQQIPALAERQALKGKEGSLIVSPPNSPIRHPPSLHSQGREKDLLAWGVKVPSSCGYLGRQWGRGFVFCCRNWVLKRLFIKLACNIDRHKAKRYEIFQRVSSKYKLPKNVKIQLLFV